MRHEAGHVAEHRAGTPLNHDGAGDGPGWETCTVERFARDSRKAGKRLRRRLRAATVVYRITFPPEEVAS